MTTDMDGAAVQRRTVSDDRLVEVLKTLARTLVKDYPLDEMLDYVCREIVDVLGVDGAGVMLEDEEGNLRFVAASDDTIRHIEALQIELGEGPCLAAYQRGEPVLVTDLATHEDFQRFAPRALSVGMASVHSFALVTDTQCVGAINVYSAAPTSFDERAVEVGKILADVTTAYILNARSLAESVKLAGQLEWALHSRVLIEQAKGKLSERLDVDVASAFDVLRTYARSHGLRLHDVARDVVEGRLDLEHPPRGRSTSRGDRS